jgi:hypothetical protein
MKVDMKAMVQVSVMIMAFSIAIMMMNPIASIPVA